MDQNQLYDKQTVEVMRRMLHKDSNCIDIGCHTGVMLDKILEIASEGFHYGFEPLPDLYNHLVRKYANSGNVEIRNSALSESSGVVTFQHVISNPGYSGLRRRKYDHLNEEIREITVMTERLDDVIPALMSISFIKIDVEGAELQVLKGAVETVKRCRPVIVFEHGLGAADYYGTTPEDVFDLLVDGCGFRCFIMEDWLSSNGQDNLVRTEFASEFRSGRNYYFMAAI